MGRGLCSSADPGAFSGSGHRGDGRGRPSHDAGAGQTLGAIRIQICARRLAADSGGASLLHARTEYVLLGVVDLTAPAPLGRPLPAARRLPEIQAISAFQPSEPFGPGVEWHQPEHDRPRQSQNGEGHVSDLCAATERRMGHAAPHRIDVRHGRRLVGSRHVLSRTC